MGGESAGTAGVSQSAMFGDNPRATGYHNFSAQARVLRKLASSGVIHAHWGSCERTFGEPPAAFLNHKAAAPRQTWTNRMRKRVRARKQMQRSNGRRAP